jgi:dienelactone hydrolase
MASAAVHTKMVEYKQGDTALEGYQAWDDAVQDRRPGVLIVHEWTGLLPGQG